MAKAIASPSSRVVVDFLRALLRETDTGTMWTIWSVVEEEVDRRVGGNYRPDVLPRNKRSVQGK